MAPVAFDKCRAAGGKIRTKTLSGDRYMHICILKGGAPSVGGEIHHKKASSQPGKAVGK